MADHINPVEASHALDNIELRRRQIVAEIDVPAWYWWGLALGWLGLGLLTAFTNPWVVLVATLGFGAAHSAVATRVIDGRHRSSQLSVRSEVVNRHVPALVIGFLIALIGVTIGIALIADGLGAPQPGLIASVLVAIAALIGGPQLMTFVRRRAERSERR